MAVTVLYTKSCYINVFYSEGLVYKTVLVSVGDRVDDSPSSVVMDERAAVKAFIVELSGHKNFIWFTAMNLVQVSVTVLHLIRILCNLVTLSVVLFKCWVSNIMNAGRRVFY